MFGGGGKDGDNGDNVVTSQSESRQGGNGGNVVTSRSETKEVKEAHMSTDVRARPPPPPPRSVRPVPSRPVNLQWLFLAFQVAYGSVRRKRHFTHCRIET